MPGNQINNPNKRTKALENIDHIYCIWLSVGNTFLLGKGRGGALLNLIVLLLTVLLLPATFHDIDRAN